MKSLKTTFSMKFFATTLLVGAVAGCSCGGGAGSGNDTNPNNDRPPPSDTTPPGGDTGDGGGGGGGGGGDAGGGGGGGGGGDAGGGGGGGNGGPDGNGNWTREDKLKDPNGFWADLRIRGVNADGLKSVGIAVKHAMVLVDGQETELHLDTSPIDLARVNHAWKVGAFKVPYGARHVQVIVQLDDTGTARDGGTTVFDASGPPIYFESTPWLLAEKDKAVIEMDLTRSFAELDGVWALLPHLTVRY